MGLGKKKRTSVRILDRRILAVAVEGGCKDWSAYIGVVPGHDHVKEWEIAYHDCTKLAKDLAEFLFPEFSDLTWRS